MSDSDDPEYTIDVNGKRFELSDEFRWRIERRAENEYSENSMFSCWWRVADADDAEDDDSHHEEGDPILVIETQGPMVPWEQLDQLEIEMQDINPTHDVSGDEPQDIDEGGGMQTVHPDAARSGGGERDESEDEVERTHFPMTPHHYEDVPQPETDDFEKLPPKPTEMSDDPALIYWIPEHPESEERWSTGEAIVPAHSWVEWNVQARADEIRLQQDGEVKDNSHDHFESMCRAFDCEQVAEYSTSQNTPDGSDEDDTPGQVERKGEDWYEDGAYGGDNFHV